MSFSSWFPSLLCCGAREKPRSGESSLRSASSRNIVILRDQPAVVPRPSAEPLWLSGDRTYEKTADWEGGRVRLRRPTSRESHSVRKHWFSRSPSSSSSSARRLQISGPTNFRHLQSESFQLPPPPTSRPRPRPRSFRPIELSIYQPYNRLSPILPHLECNVTPPPRAHTASSSPWDHSSEPTLAHERSYSTMSFHLPRRQHGRQGSGISDASASPPRIPPKSRARAYTSPNTERIVERIASALLEKERLQAEIDSVIERQSIYMGSRPSTGHDMRSLAPMPSIPALPAAAPSFAERLSLDGRPRTAPSRVDGMTLQDRTLQLTAAAQSHAQAPAAALADDEEADRPLAPPLPLVLRPPLRKKKSFSRVSNWLFHPDEQPFGRGVDRGSPSSPTAATSATAITTSPRPIKESDGFYQCVAPPEGLPRTSMETSSSVYTWDTGRDDADEDEEEEEAKTVPTTTAWSPEQTPKQGSRHATPVIGAAGKGESERRGEASQVPAGLGVVDSSGGRHRPLSVGVAI